MTEPIYARGWPGIPARWTSSAKSGVGTSLSPASRVWFTISHGILNEIYYPRVDQACTRDLGLIITEGGMISEQIWDSPDIPEKELFFSRPSGSVMPLVWAHSECVKLKRSLHEGRLFDTSPQTVQRYQVNNTASPYAIWRFNHKCRSVMAGKALRLEVLSPATVRWSDDGWRTVRNMSMQDTGLGVHCADLLTQRVPVNGTMEFTFYWTEAGQWEDTNFSVTVS